MYQVFQIYKDSPNMNQYLLDILLVKLRVWALQILTKRYALYTSHGDYLEIAHVAELLAFNSEEDCKSFLNSNGSAHIQAPRW